MSQTINDKVTINNSYTRLNTKGKYCDKDILIVLENAKNLIPSNIKEGVTIAGVTGTLKPEATTSVCECDVESIDLPIEQIDVSLYNDGKIIYSTVDEKVYQKQDGAWVHLDAPIVPIVEDVTTESVEGYSNGDKVYDENTGNFYILSNGGWKELKLPNLLGDYDYITPTHDNQSIPLTEDEQKTYDGFSTIKVKGVDIPTVADCTKVPQVPQDTGLELNNKLVYCNINKKIYKLKAKSRDDLNDDDLNSVIYYNTELYNKDEISADAKLELKQNNISKPYKISDLFKDVVVNGKKIDFDKNVLSNDSTVEISVSTGLAGVVGSIKKVGDLENVEPGFDVVEKDATDIPVKEGENEYDYIEKVKINPVTVVNWTDYVNLPSDLQTGQKYYLKPDENHPIDTQTTYSWIVGNTYRYNGEGWDIVKPLMEYELKDPITVNTSSEPYPIELPNDFKEYGMSKVKIKVNVPKDNPVFDQSHNTEEKAVAPRYDAHSITHDETKDGFDTVWIDGVKVINLDEVPTAEELDGYEEGNLICVDDVIYVFNGTEFVEYVIEYTHPTDLTNGTNLPIEIPNNQVASKVYVTVKSSDVYAVDETYNTNPVKLKHKGGTLTPTAGTVGFQKVTLPDVTILDEPNAVEDGDATGYKEGVYVCKPGTSDVYKVVEGKFKNVVLDNWDFTSTPLNPNITKTLTIPTNVGVKSVTVKTKSLDLEEKTDSAKHSINEITPSSGKDGLSKVTIKPQNVLNVDSAKTFYNITPMKRPDFDFENNMFYLTKDDTITTDEEEIDFPKGVYKYHTVYVTDLGEVINISNVFSFKETEENKLSDIYNEITTNSTLVQNLTFSTQIQFFEEAKKVANVNIFYTNCKFEIDGNKWVLKSEEKPTYIDTIKKLSETEINTKITSVHGFSLNGLNIEFLQDENMTELIWDPLSKSVWDTVNKKWVHYLSSLFYSSYYVIVLTNLKNKNENFGDNFDYFEPTVKSEQELNGNNYPAYEKWFLLDTNDYERRDLYEAEIIQNGTYIFPNDPGVTYYKQFKINAKVNTSVVKDVTTLENASASINDVVYLVKDYLDTNHYRGLYKQFKSGEWTRLPDKTVSKEVVSSTIEQKIESEMDENNQYIAIKDVYVPAYYIKTWTDGVNGPTYNDIKDTTTGRYYFMPKGAAKNEIFSIVIPTSSGTSPSVSWKAGNVYQYEIDKAKNITWKMVNLEPEEEHTCPIPTVSELPSVDDSDSGDKVLLNEDVWEFDGTDWEKLVIAPDAPELGYALLTISKNNSTESASESDGPYAKVDAMVKIPEVEITYSPTIQENITITPLDLAQGKYDPSFISNGEKAIEGTYENVLIKSIKVDTTGIKPEVKLLDKTNVELSYKKQTYEIKNEGTGYDGYNSFTVPGVTVLDLDTLPEGEALENFAETYGSNKKICVNGIIYELNRNVEEDKFEWIASSSSLMKKTPEIVSKWFDKTYSTTDFNDTADGFENVKVKGSISEDFTTLPDAKEENVGKIAVLKDGKTNVIKDIYRCYKNETSNVYEWQPLRRSYTSNTQIKIKPNNLTQKLSEISSLAKYQAVELDKVTVEPSEILIYDNTNDIIGPDYLAENNYPYLLYTGETEYGFIKNCMYKAVSNNLGTAYEYVLCDVPEGTLKINKSGKYDVRKYANVEVSVNGLYGNLSKIPTSEGQTYIDVVDITTNLSSTLTSLTSIYFEWQYTDFSKEHMEFTIPSKDAILLNLNNESGKIYLGNINLSKVYTKVPVYIEYTKAEPNSGAKDSYYIRIKDNSGVITSPGDMGGLILAVGEIGYALAYK